MTIDFNTLKNADIKNLKDLSNLLEQWISQWQEANFAEVHIVNQRGNISEEIQKKFPGFEVSWHGHEGYVGEHQIFVPRDRWCLDIKKELAKFDSFYGKHTEGHYEYSFRTDIEVPGFVLNDFKYCLGIGEDPLVKTYTRQWLYNHHLEKYINKLCSGLSEKTYLEAKYIVEREWFEDIWYRNPNDEAFKFFKDVKIEI